MARILLVVCVVISVQCFSNGSRSRLPSSSAANVRLYVTKKGFDYANTVMMDSIVSEIEGLRIPTVSIKKTIWWNTIRLSLYDSRVKTVNLRSSSLSLRDGYMQLSLELTNAKIIGKYDGGFLGRGTYSVKLKRVLLTQLMSLGRNAKGKPYLINARCNTQIAQDDIISVFKGGSSLIINILVQLVKRSVRDNVQDMICKSVKDGIKEKGRKLPELYQDVFSLQRVKCGQLHFPLLARPVMERGYVDFIIEGKTNSSCYPLYAPTRGNGVSLIRYVPSRYKMISIVLSDRFFNSLAELYFKAGVVQLGEMQTPQNFRPELRVAINLKSPPTFKTNSSNSFATVFTKAVVKANQNTYKLELAVVGQFEIEEKNRVLSGKVTNLSFDVTFAKGTPQDFKDVVIPGLQMIKTVIAEKVSRFMHNIAPLPLISTIKIINKHVLHRQGYMVLEADVVEKI